MKKNTDISRRDFAKNIAFSTLGVSILGENIGNSVEHKSFGRAKHVIIITLSGGISHVDSFDPKESQTNAGIKPISTNVAGLTVSQYFPEIAKHADKFTILRGMTSKSGDHNGSTYQLKTSYNRSSLIVHPTIGPIRSFVQGKKHATLPDTVLINAPGDHPKQGYFDSSYTPLPIINPNEGLRFSKSLVSDSQMNNRMEILKSLNNIFQKQFNNPAISSYSTLYDETLKTLKSKDLEAFDLTKESKEKRESYGMDTFGQGCLLANRLINTGVSVVEVGLGSWDHHTDIADNMERRAPILDKALAALFADLQASGKLSETLIVVESEFGRTPAYKENGKVEGLNMNGGRDHWPKAFSCLIGGCGLGGKVIGKTDEHGKNVIERQISFGELNATIAHSLGIKSDLVWMTPVNSSSPNRPMNVSNGAKPILELM